MWSCVMTHGQLMSYPALLIAIERYGLAIAKGKSDLDRFFFKNKSAFILISPFLYFESLVEAILKGLFEIFQLGNEFQLIVFITHCLLQDFITPSLEAI